MKTILKILIPIVVFGSIAYYYQDTIREQFFPCTAPIPYTLGTFDEQFGISQKYFLDALSEAEMIWEKPFGKELFTYKEGGSSNRILKVNLVYDYRQEATSKLEDLGIVVEDNRASYDSLKIKLATLQKDYNQEKSDFNIRVNAFNEKNQVYEREVKLSNSRGGAPKDEYDKLEQKRLELNAESAELQKIQTNVGEMVDEINALVVVLNRLASTLNISVKQYNTIGASRGESFEEGVYVRDSSGQEIDIYEFSSRSKLVRVLAHELGHALDLEHVEDPKAIMYRLNQGNSEVLVKDDLDALKARCGVE